MKLATFNVNSLKMRWPIVKDWLAAHNPNILMIQEIKGTDLPLAEIAAAGYHIQSVTQKAYNGVAALTKIPATVLHDRLPGMAEDEQARFLSLTYQGLTIVNIYAPNGNPVGTDKFTYKIKWLNALYDHLSELRRAQQNVIIAGDFNIIPDAIDAAHPENWTGDALFQRESRDLYRAILHLGYTDAVRALHPRDPSLYTFWDYQAGSWQRNNGIRIDHVLLSPYLTDRLVATDIDRGPRALEKPSDHTPVLVEINI